MRIQQSNIYSQRKIRRGVFLTGDPATTTTYPNILLLPYMFAFHQKDYTPHRSSFSPPTTTPPTLPQFFHNNLLLTNIFTIEVNFWGPTVSLAFLDSKKLVYKTAFGNKVRVVQKTDEFYDTNYFKTLGVN
jgi:hypothetical protein